MRKELLTFALVSLVVSIQPAQARGMGHGGGQSMAHGGARGGAMARGGGAAARGGARSGGSLARGGARGGGAVSRGGGVRGGSGLNAGGFNRSGAGGARFQSFGAGNGFSRGNFANQSGNSIKSGKQFTNDPTKAYASNNGNTTNNVYASGSVNASASGYPPASTGTYPAGYPAAYPTTYPTTYPAANPYAAGAAAGWAASKYNQTTQPSYGYGFMPPVLPPVIINAPTTTNQAPANPEPTQQANQAEDLNSTATKARVFARNFASEMQVMRAQQMSRYANGQPIPQVVPYAMPQNAAPAGR